MPVRFLSLSKLFTILSLFAVVVVTPSTLFPFIVGKYTFFKVAVELALICALLAWGFESRSLPAHFSYTRLLKRPLVLAVSIFILIFLLAGFFGIDPHASFWSSFERGEGGFLLLHCYAFFILLLLLFEHEDDWKRLFKYVIGAGALVVVYGLLAAMGSAGFLGHGLCERFSGSLGNPAYLGTFSIFALFFTAYLAASGEWLSGFWRKNILPRYLFWGIFFFTALLLSQTRGAVLGLAAGVLLALLYLFFVLKDKRARAVIALSISGLILFGSLGVYFRQSIDLLPYCTTGGNRILDVSFQGESYQTRLILWQQAIQAFKERPILGWGPENFAMAFEKYFDIRHTVWFDRAHSIFFDYLVSSGFLGLSSFLAIFLTFYWQFWRWVRSRGLGGHHKEAGRAITHYQIHAVEALIFALPFAYLVQGSVLFDVLPTYIVLFLFLAFASRRFGSSNFQ